MQSICLMILLIVKLVVGTTELDSLLEVKRGIQEDSSGKVLGSWDPKSLASNGCPLDWYGITCSSGHVTSLMLNGLGLVGNFTFSSITGLKMLRNLSISTNRFEGTISNVVGSLSSLEYLDISSNLFHGPLPSEITNIRRLVHLNLSLNNLEGTVPSTFGNLKQLKHLDLHSNNFSGKIMSFLSQLGSVAYFDLSSNGFTGTLDLGLGSDEFVSAIEYLNVSHNNLGGYLFSHDGMPYFDNLEVFDASNNQFVGTVPSFNFMVSLRILRLGSNKLSGSLPEALLQESSMSLSELDLSLNELKGPVDSISSTTLRNLNLSFNKLTGILPLNIGHCAIIDLSSNLLSGNLSRIQGWGNYVEEINLSSNLLTGTFPIQTSQFLRLTSFKISNNSIGGVLAPVLATYPELNTIDFSCNQFSGTLLPSLFNSTRLIYLNMSFNNLSGTIPIQKNSSLLESSKILSLEFLDLSYNSLSDHLPREIGNYHDLAFLDLSNNHFEGGIPDTLPGALKVFNVSYNNLSGLVPENLRNFPDSAFHPGNDLLSFPYSASSPQGLPNLMGHNSPKRSYIKPVLIAALIGGVSSLGLLTFIVCYRTHRQYERNHTKKHSEKLGNQREASSVLATSAPNKDVTKRKAEEAFPPVPLMSPGNPSSSNTPHREMPPGPIEVCSPDKLVGELHLFHSSLVFSAEELSLAPAEMIGRSCHGTLYKAVLQSGEVLAVKWLKEGIAKGRKEFAREVMKLGSIRHPNLVSLQGYYWGAKEYERMLISNYIDSPCLSLYLNESDARNLPALNLDDRYRIAVDIARCLTYLHNERAIPHGNLKSTNILLEPPNMKHPLLTDYSLHRLMTSSGTAEQVLTAGALGYRPPEFCSTSKPCPSLKSDVYAFGVILLELLTGKCSAEMILGSSGEVVDLTEWVRLLCVENRLNECVSSQIVNSNDHSVKVAEALLEVALRCILPADERPDMKSVLDDLTPIAAAV
ncbi:probable inactive receptor kinase At5g10020 [Cynara cardunculus var. scolymus]|uniref:probable inactive receptor kinase At5g10020 n=1 Tax=Cynara cardunculus var. scolymus TaxID=59895 RepID=UPI000D62DBA3|nr:probable inactive receptor kinase At5g10020 [Cynara cardunculus var. scolymus]